MGRSFLKMVRKFVIRVLGSLDFRIYSLEKSVINVVRVGKFLRRVYNLLIMRDFIFERGYLNVESVGRFLGGF